MTDINKTVLVGRLTKDIEIKYTNSGAAIGNLSIAVNRSRKQDDQWIDEASFFDVKIYGKMAESLRPYLTKGKQIAVEGFLKQERWQKDGQNFSKVTVGAENVQLLGGNSGSDSQPQNDGYGYYGN
ncbi:single-stranded DNA-binding protein [uncultured Treponema sp.]|uniref:single-stranded DNA-binding protein n=1 Tax=uncultured Treponema sp. TaxID=162155 RepID=UPI0025F51947|nr:single-stranded DNA-binding protein [uncultured Treponema sp.]